MIVRSSHLHYIHLAEAQAQRHRLSESGPHTTSSEIWIYVRLVTVIVICGSAASIASYFAA
jgi:hypothetical protein